MNFSGENAIGAVAGAKASANWIAGFCGALMLFAYRLMLRISILARQMNY